MDQTRFIEARQAFSRKDYDQTLALLAPMLATGSSEEPLLALAVNASILAERFDDALPVLLRLRRNHPENTSYARITAQVLNRIGTALMRRRRMAEAEAAFLDAISHWPQHIESHYNLATLLAKMDLHQASLQAWQRLHQLAPQAADVTLELVISLARNERHDEASALLDAMPAMPSAAPGHLLLLKAQALAWTGRAQDAAALLATLPTEQGQHSRLLEIADELTNLHELDAARRIFAHLFHLDEHGRRAPGLKYLFFQHLVLPPVYRDLDDLARCRIAFDEGLTRLDEALEHAVSGGRCATDLAQLAFCNFHLAYQGRNDRELQQRLGGLMARLASRFALPGLAPKRPRAPGPVRVGLVSSHLRESTAGAYFRSWIRMLCESGLEVHAFQLGPISDAFTEAVGREANLLHRLQGSVDSHAKAIAEGGFDVLLYPEIGMTADLLPLASLRLAPVQLCAWGHPVTTGLPTIDGYFTCADMEPEDAAEHYSERLLPLPGLGTDYLQPAIPDRSTRAALGLPEQGRLYLLPHAPFKMHPDNDAIWASIAAKDPEAVLIMFRGPRAGMLPPIRRRLSEALAVAGADPQRQLSILPMTSRERFLQINQACDVMVDALHWSGGNTSIDALICGLPVVTCPGRFMRSRQSMAMLRRLGLEELVCSDPADLVDLAVAVASDRSRRARLSNRIRENLPALFDATGVAEALTAHIHRMLDEAGVADPSSTHP